MWNLHSSVQVEQANKRHGMLDELNVVEHKLASCGVDAGTKTVQTSFTLHGFECCCTHIGVLLC
jgi:hypothetical protein